MLEVYILIEVEPKPLMANIEKKIIRLSRLYELTEVLGPYEIMAKFKFRDKEQLMKVLNELSHMEGVKDYLVLVVTKKFR